MMINMVVCLASGQIKWPWRMQGISAFVESVICWGLSLVFLSESDSAKKFRRRMAWIFQKTSRVPPARCKTVDQVARLHEEEPTRMCSDAFGAWSHRSLMFDFTLAVVSATFINTGNRGAWVVARAELTCRALDRRRGTLSVVCSTHDLENQVTIPMDGVEWQ
jgi:hypothetical protein